MKRLLIKIRTTFWRMVYAIHDMRRRPHSRHSREQAMAIARKYGLEREVEAALRQGCTPDEALQEWDIYPYQEASHTIRFK